MASLILGLDFPLAGAFLGSTTFKSEPRGQREIFEFLEKKDFVDIEYRCFETVRLLFFITLKLFKKYIA